jgi:hypothetical protein
MKSKVLWALVALNVCLLACLVGQWVGATAASAQAAPAVSDYLLIPGNVQASPSQVIYMIDERSGFLSARTMNNNQLVDMAPIDLNRLFNPAPVRGGGR